MDQYLRTTVDSSSQPTPMEIGAVMSTCACCGKAGQEKTRCRFRNAECSNCGDISERCADNVGNLLARQVPRAAGNTDKCCCCGQVGHRRPDCPRRNESCSVNGKRGHLSHVCRSFGLLRWNPLSLTRKEKFNTFFFCGAHCSRKNIRHVDSDTRARHLFNSLEDRHPAEVPQNLSIAHRNSWVHRLYMASRAPCCPTANENGIMASPCSPPSP